MVTHRPPRRWARRTKAPGTCLLAEASGSAHEGLQAEPRILLVGGNHDVRWMKEAAPAVVASLRKAGEHFDEASLTNHLVRSDPGLVHHHQVERLRTLPKQSALRIVVVHHPVASMPVAVEVAPFAGLLNAGQVLSACFAARVDVVLHGHVHTPWFAEQR